MNSKNQMPNFNQRQNLLLRRNDDYGSSSRSIGQIDQKYMIPTESQIDEFIENLKGTDSRDRPRIKPNDDHHLRHRYTDNDSIDIGFDVGHNPNNFRSGKLINYSRPSRGGPELSYNSPFTPRPDRGRRSQDVVYRPYEDGRIPSQVQPNEIQVRDREREPNRSRGLQRRSRSVSPKGKSRSRTPKDRKRSPERIGRFREDLKDTNHERRDQLKRSSDINEFAAQEKYMKFQHNPREREIPSDRSNLVQYPGIYYQGSRSFNPEQSLRQFDHKKYYTPNESFQRSHLPVYGFTVEGPPLHHQINDESDFDCDIPRESRFSDEFKVNTYLEEDVQEKSKYKSPLEYDKERPKEFERFGSIFTSSEKSGKLSDEEDGMEHSVATLDQDERKSQTIQQMQSRDSLLNCHLNRINRKDKSPADEKSNRMDSSQWDSTRIPTPPPPPSLTDFNKMNIDQLSPAKVESSKKLKHKENQASHMEETSIISSLLGNKDVSLSSLLEAAMETVGSKRHTEDPDLKQKIVADCEAKISQLYRHRISGTGAFLPDPIPAPSDLDDACLFSNKHPYLEFASDKEEKLWFCAKVVLPENKITLISNKVPPKQNIEQIPNMIGLEMHDAITRIRKDYSDSNSALEESLNRKKSSKKDSKRSSRKRSRSRDKKKSMRTREDSKDRQHSNSIHPIQTENSTPGLTDPYQLNSYNNMYPNIQQNVHYPSQQLYPVQEPSFQPAYHPNIPQQNWAQEESNFQVNNFPCYDGNYINRNENSAFREFPPWQQCDGNVRNWEQQQGMIPPQVMPQNYMPFRPNEFFPSYPALGNPNINQMGNVCPSEVVKFMAAQQYKTRTLVELPKFSRNNNIDPQISEDIIKHNFALNTRGVSNLLNCVEEEEHHNPMKVSSNSLEIIEIQDESTQDLLNIEECEMQKLVDNFLISFKPISDATEELKKIQEVDDICASVKYRIRSGSEALRDIYKIVNGLLCRVELKFGGVKCLKIIIPANYEYKAIKILHNTCHNMDNVSLANIVEVCFYNVCNKMSDIDSIITHCKVCKDSLREETKYTFDNYREFCKSNNIERQGRNFLRHSRDRSIERHFRRSKERSKERTRVSREKSKERFFHIKRNRSRDQVLRERSRDRNLRRTNNREPEYREKIKISFNKSSKDKREEKDDKNAKESHCNSFSLQPWLLDERFETFDIGNLSELRCDEKSLPVNCPNEIFSKDDKTVECHTKINKETSKEDNETVESINENRSKTYNESKLEGSGPEKLCSTVHPNKKSSEPFTSENKKIQNNQNFPRPTESNKKVVQILKSIEHKAKEHGKVEDELLIPESKNNEKLIPAPMNPKGEEMQKSAPSDSKVQEESKCLKTEEIGNKQPQGDFKSRVRHVQLLNKNLTDIITKLESGDSSIDPIYSMKGSMLCRKCSVDGNNEVRIVAEIEHIEDIGYIVHTMAPVHAPFQKTMAIFKKHFTPIDNIDEIIKNVVNKCEQCKEKDKVI